MGTRNVTRVLVDGEFRISQYCQWDGYPEGQGQTIVEFLRAYKHDMDDFKDKLRHLQTMTDEELDELWKSVGKDADGAAGGGFVTVDTGNRMKEKYPHLTRDCGAEILELVAKGEADAVSLDQNFHLDGLFCEWCYVLDLDNDRLEVYKGFFETEDTIHGRWADEVGSHEEFSPVGLVAIIPFETICTGGEFNLTEYLSQYINWETGDIIKEPYDADVAGNV